MKKFCAIFCMIEKIILYIYCGNIGIRYADLCSGHEAGYYLYLVL